MRLSSCGAARLLWAVALLRPLHADAAPPIDDVPLGQTTFRVLAGADGLRNLVISSIAQDASGFLWLVSRIPWIRRIPSWSLRRSLLFRGAVKRLDTP